MHVLNIHGLATACPNSPSCPHALTHDCMHSCSISPGGSAVCLYSAENSRETNPRAVFNQGIFDIFREDLLTSDNRERENGFVEVYS